ncbi:hypothetical protein DPSP01_000731 [Paraphaeosphaeria sporulosa]|uniref:Cupredoxin n=1 Tax=Paraphaeosphaeria sporulosa TaxID=1460663 RepID=A0A177CQH8_9PLEO|nr:Cupredoxin [Paraphaeosphaeria sporulosa]OAG09481.1 Cupredoxin [Paraphaeosphaeria sporulosa]
MHFLLLFKLACLSSFSVSVFAQRGRVGSSDGSKADQSRVIGLTRPSPTDGRNPLETQGWISPEYKWFYEYPLPLPPTKSKKQTWTGDDGAEIDYYEVELKSFSKQIYPDLPATPMVGYDGMAPGPTLVMQQNREAVVRFINNGPSNMSVHVHGQYNRSPFDGWASDMTSPGQYKDYYYPNAQNARTIWYHDHTEFASGEHAYRGEEGYYILTDPEEQALGLPSGQYDVTLAIAAKIYRSDGSLYYDSNHDAGLWGDVILVNEQPWPYFNVEARPYRFRLLNGAVSRTFDLTFNTDDGEMLPFDVIGSDCGLFNSPVNSTFIALSMGERYELVIDFSNYRNQNITLLNGRGIGDNVDYPATNRIMRFIVGEGSGDSGGGVPQTLRNNEQVAPAASNAKDFTFGRGQGGSWEINGVGFRDVENRILTKPERGTYETWELSNGAGGGTHPVHIHLVDFKIISRTGGRNEVADYEGAGWKDVVWLAAGESVQVIARYAPWDGIYMFHCHNLVHEDHDMLVAFSVPNLEKWGYTNSTLFIDPNQPEFKGKDFNSDDFTEEAINSKIAWLYSTNPYNKGNIAGVYSALDAYSQGQYWTQAPDGDHAQPTGGDQSADSTPTGSPSAWTTLVSSATQVPESSGLSGYGL